MSKLTCLLLATTFAGCAAGPADPAESEAADEITLPNAGVLYSDGNWFGSSLPVQGGLFGTWNEVTLDASFDNIASSLTVRAGCGVEVHVNPDFTGGSAFYTSSIALFPIGLDNAISSYRAYCTPKCPVGKHYCGPDAGCVTGFCE